MKNVITLLTKSVLIPLGLTATAPARDPGIHKKILGSRASGSSDSATRKLITLNKNMKVLMKIDKSVEDSGLLIKGFIQAIKNETKEQRGWSLGILVGRN